MKKFHTVTFLPENETLKVEDRISIFETITNSHHQNINLNFACGAEGVCQKCKVRSFKPMGPLTPTEKGCLSEEEISKGIRLACQARVIQDTKAEIIYKMPFSIRKVEERFSARENARSRVEKIHITAKNKPFTERGAQNEENNIRSHCWKSRFLSGCPGKTRAKRYSRYLEEKGFQLGRFINEGY